MEKRDRFDIMIKSKSTQDQIASYLVKAVLGLRDRENANESVRLFGSGAAIPDVILVTEIIRARYKNLSSVVTFENMEKTVQEDGNTNKISIPAIRIKLTGKPTEEELNSPGYQAPNDVKDDKHVELFDYVMIYAKNLFFWSSRDRNRKQNPNQHRQFSYVEKHQRHEESTENKPESDRQNQNMRVRGGADNTQRKPEDFKRKPDDHEDHRERQQQNQRPYNPRPRYQDKDNRSEPIKRGEVRTRGGQRKA